MSSPVCVPSFAYPFKKLKDMDTCFESLDKVDEGNFLFNDAGLWHSGVHYADSALSDAEGDTKPLCAIADGELVAYRVNADYLEDEEEAKYSTGFFLVRHKLEYPAENKLTFFSLYMHTAPKSAYGFDPVDYEVKSGDTLSKIAQGHGMSLDAIKALNPEITPPSYVINIGQKVKVIPITQAPTVLTKESPTDCVHILPEPLEVKAGTPLGLVGEYNDPEERNQKVLHIECFTGDDVKAFAEKAQQTYPTDTSAERPSPTSLIIPSGTTLYKKEALPAKKVKEGVTHTNLRKAYAEGETGYKTVRQVKTGVILEIDESTLNHDRYKVLKNAGVDVSVQGWTVHKDYIVDTTYDAYTATETVTNQERSLPIEKTKPRVKDMEGKEFFELSDMYVAVENCTPDHGVTFKWAKAFDTASSDNASLFTNYMEFYKGEIEPDALVMNPLFKELFAAIDKDGNGRIDYPLELQNATKNADVRKLASRYAVKHASEWGDTLQAIWQQMKAHQDTLVANAETDEEKQQHEANAKYMANQLTRAQQLKFFPDCSGIDGFPSSDIVYFLHPIRVVGELGKQKCRIDTRKFVEEYEKAHSSIIGWYEKNKKTKKYEKTTISKLNTSSKNNLTKLINALIKYYQGSTYECSVAKFAYILATIRVESYQWKTKEFFGITNENISYAQAEIDYGCGSTARRASVAKRNGCEKDGDGYKYRGRGFVQITWKINYQKFNGINSIDFVEHPEKMLDFDIQVAVTVEGMERGLFSKGNTLSKYINDTKKDFKGARAIINGSDKDWIIEDYAKGIEKCLEESL